MRVKSNLLAVIVLMVMLGGVFASSAAGWWQTTSSKVPVKFDQGEAAGEYNPADIRGSYGFSEVSDLFDIPLETLGRAFELPPDEDLSLFKNKGLEEMYAGLPGGAEIGTASVRLFVAYYTGLPYEPDEDTYLLGSAVDLLLDRGGLSPERLAYLEGHRIDLSGTVDLASPEESEEPTAESPVESDANVEPEAVPAAEATPAPVHTPAAAGSGPGNGEGDPSAEDHEAPDRMVRGKTTFADLLGYGLSQELIEQVIGGPMPNRLTLVRDYCVDQGLEFAAVKTALQAEVDALE